MSLECLKHIRVWGMDRPMSNEIAELVRLIAAEYPDLFDGEFKTMLDEANRRAAALGLGSDGSDGA